MDYNSETDSRIREILDQAKAQQKPGVPEATQECLARLINLLPEIRGKRDAALVATAEIAAAAILADPPNLKLASDLCSTLYDRTHPREISLRGILRSDSPSVRVILGLGALLCLAIPTVMLGALWWPTGQILGLPSNLLAVVALSGALGSVASIMVRMQDFATLTKVDPHILFFMGFFKPMVGTAFALFVFAMLRSGLSPLELKVTALYAWPAVGFLTGFSERLVRDLVSRAEKSIGGGA